MWLAGDPKERSWVYFPGVAKYPRNLQGDTNE